jgi:hypothetical protein
MQPIDAFLTQLAVMLRMLIAGAVAPTANVGTRKSQREGDRK